MPQAEVGLDFGQPRRQCVLRRRESPHRMAAVRQGAVFEGSAVLGPWWRWAFLSVAVRALYAQQLETALFATAAFWRVPPASRTPK